MNAYPRPRNAVCLASDQNYIDYTYVTVLSIAEHTSPNIPYEVVILSSDILEYKKQAFYKLNSENFLVRFVEMNEYIKNSNLANFFTSSYITLATYFRYFIPQIFNNYDKVLYLDGDVIATNDIAEIFNINIDSHLLGVVRRPNSFYLSEARCSYMRTRLNCEPKEYFCAGILLYNIKECLKFDLMKKCFETQERLVNPPKHDQDVLNAVTSGHNCILPTRWHFMWWGYLLNKLADMRKASPEVYEDYVDAAQNPFLIHYGGERKPWHAPQLPFADLWWQIARKTPFYEHFLHDMYQAQADDVANSLKKHCASIADNLASDFKKDCSALTVSQNNALAQIRKHEELMRLELLRATVLSSKRSSLKLRHALYRLLSKVTGGRLRKKFLTKRQEIKAQLDFLKRCAR